MSTPEQPRLGPCVQWISADDVATVCTALDTSGGTEVYDDAAEKASDLLYLLSGRQFPGVCERTVRPCEPRYCRVGGDPCGCCQLSRVKLAGGVLAVSEVKIDGAVLDASEYRVDRRKYLVRLADTNGNRQSWPGCQRLDLDDTEEGTFAVTYSYGQDPPLMGVEAAAELACQIATAVSGGECLLPAGTTRVTRQGITIDLVKLQSALTSLTLTSAFLNAYNPQGMRRRSSLWTPDLQPFAKPVG